MTKCLLKAIFIIHCDHILTTLWNAQHLNQSKFVENKCFLPHIQEKKGNKSQVKQIS
jgi:hypothetical protein